MDERRHVLSMPYHRCEHRSNWWTIKDLNLGPESYELPALNLTELMVHIIFGFYVV